MIDIAEREFVTPTGTVVNMFTRPSTMDFDVCQSAIVEDEYGLAGQPALKGWAIDVGAHIGAVSITLAARNPSLNVVSVEIVPENQEVLRDNIRRNRLTERVNVVEEAAGGPDELSRTCYMRHRSHPEATTAYVNKHRFIGNSFWSAAAGGAFDSESVEIPTVSLSVLMDRFGIDEVIFLKIDAEGAEWAFLRDPAISKVQYMIGEYHWDYAGQGDVAKKVKGAKPYKRKDTAQAEIHALLDKTHRVTVDEHPTIGHFAAVLR